MLVDGVVGKDYSATISGKDINPGDNLEMNITGLPFGVYQGICTESATTTTNGFTAPGAYISCAISGYSVKAGSYQLVATLKDDKGGTTSKIFPLTIK